MKRIVLAAATAATLISAAPGAEAQTVSIGGSVATVCAITAGATSVAINAGTIPVTGSGELDAGTVSIPSVAFTGYCNAANTLTVDASNIVGPTAVTGFTSTITYNATVTSPNNTAVTDSSGASATTDAARVAFTGATMSFGAYGSAAAPLMAGAYAGTVVVTLAANP